jgi:hypothetical protein
MRVFLITTRSLQRKEFERGKNQSSPDQDREQKALFLGGTTTQGDAMRLPRFARIGGAYVKASPKNKQSAAAQQGAMPIDFIAILFSVNSLAHHAKACNAKSAPTARTRAPLNRSFCPKCRCRILSPVGFGHTRFSLPIVLEKNNLQHADPYANGQADQSPFR